MTEKVLDLEEHEDDTGLSVLKRRIMFVVLIALCITMAAPSFGSCSDAFGVGATQTEGAFTIDGERVEVSVADFGTTNERLGMTRAMLSGGRAPSLDEEDVWRHILLDRAAQNAGIHVSPGAVTRFIAGFFGKDGKLDEDEYRRQLDAVSGGRLNHETFSRTVEELMRQSEYQRLYAASVGQIAAEDAFEEWQKDNEKLTVEYVVQPHEPLVPEVAEVVPSDKDLKTYMTLPKVKSEFEIPASRVVETAYVLADEVTDAQFAAMKAFVVDRGLVASETDVGPEAWGVFWEARDTHFTRRNWVKLREPAYEEAKAKYEKDLAAWNELPEADRGAKPEAPDDPALADYPAEAKDQFTQSWSDFVTREVLARMVVKTLAEQAAREAKSFADLLPAYAPLGVRVVENDKPLTEGELEEQYPEGLAKDSTFLASVRSYLKGPVGDRPFTPEVHEVPVPTTNSSTRVARRGYMVLRLSAWVPPRQLELDEARDKAVEMWRKDEVVNRAKKRLEELEAKVRKGDVSLEDGAREMGLEVQVLRRFNRNTKEPREPTVPAGEEATPELQRAIDRIRHRNRVQRYYGLLEPREPGDFYSQVLTDSRTGAAYLLRLVAKDMPSPVEMSETDLAVTRRRLRSTQTGWENELLGYEALASRYQLETQRAKREAEKEKAESDG